MKKYILSIALLASMNAMEVKEINAFASPESVVANKDYVFVSNVGQKIEPLNKDLDGYINIISKADDKINVFVKNLNAPKGMKIINNTLYVVDIDTLYGFDITSKKEVFKLEIKGSVFLNAIESLDNDTLLVSDTGTYTIFEINLKDKNYKTFMNIDKNYGGPNGLLIDKNSLYVVGYNPSEKDGGAILKIDLASKNVEKLSDNLEQFDGIVKINDDILVSSWGKELNGYIYKLNQNKLEKLDLKALKGPADMFYDNYTNTLLVPEMANNSLLKIKL
ncbi:ATP-binding protein [Campylobacter sp. RM12642]|uniref:ATP-binding protein n=1 Tax=Campylobacter sp. RM12642 TaxID=2735736 RepID=UPI0030157C78|nr:ATP-binding protein [Campylobacter sp. RM12642]